MKNELNFWLAVFIAIAVRVAVTVDRTDRLLTIGLKALLSVVVGVFSAVVFTDAVLAYRNLDPDTFLIPVAVLIGFTAESIVKLIVTVVPKDTKALKDLLSTWRGGK